jgi:hypothetical protein
VPRILRGSERAGAFAGKTSRNYSLTAAPYDGIFRGGNASVEVDYSSFSGRRSVYGSVIANVQLRGGGK